MKLKLIALGSLLASALLTFNSRGAVFLSENFEYTNGNLTAVSGGAWSAVSGGGTLPITVGSATATFTNVPSGTSGEDDKRDISGQPYTSGVLYLSALVAISNAPTSANGDYFLSLYSTNGTGGGFSTRIFVSATATGWSFGLINSGTAPADWTSDLTTNTWYKIIVRYDLGSKATTFGVFTPDHIPADDSELAVSSPAAATQLNVTSVAIRQGGGAGAAWRGAFDYIRVGDSLADVAATNTVPPAILLQPLDSSSFLHDTAIFSTLAVGEATNAPLTYQWFYNTNTPLVESVSVIGVTSNLLTLTNLALIQAGTYSAVATDAGGSNTTRFAVLTVSPAAIPPIIDTDITPVTVNKIVGDKAVFTVAAHALPAPGYIWNFVPNTNTSVTNIVTGGTVVSDQSGSTLTVPLFTTNQSGKYFVTITNNAGYKITNSSLATLTVSNSPFISIADLRSIVDAGYLPTDTNSYFTVQGIVTTWTNLTTAAQTNILFYIQDDTRGIPVFWAGADNTNTPPAGAIVKATGRLSSFNNLLELNASFTNSLTPVIVISTNNPLPEPQPLPFDPTVTNNLALMKAMEATYMVASNVFLTSGTTFTSGSNEGITNILQQVKTNTMLNLVFTNQPGVTFTMFVNASTDIKTQAKPSGPVTVIGVLGNFSTVGYEFTPSRYADIISYVRITNTVTQVKHYGDLLTNLYTENVLRPGETMTTTVDIGDAAGGTVTLTPDTSTLPPSASWSGITGGGVGKGTFTFTPVPGDSGTNYAVNLNVSSSAGTSYTNKFTVYVPTLTEQKMAITEFLANPTTNSSLPNFNPLHRATDTTGISSNDIYIEIANTTNTPVDFADWNIFQNTTKIQDFDAVNPAPPTLDGNSAMVIYGGTVTDAPNLAVQSFDASGVGFILPNTTGTIILRNKAGNIVDRVVYTAANLSTNGSLTRFPTIDSPFVPQEFVSTNRTTAGLQYDGSTWDKPPQLPAGVSNIVSAIGSPLNLTFPADPAKMTTLWSASTLTDTFRPVAGKQFPTTAGSFNITNSSPTGFYLITSQTNYPPTP